VQRLLELLRFDGRLSRLGYWRAYLLLAIAGTATLLVGYFAIILMGSIGAIFLLPVVPVGIASLAIVTRRLHDRGKSAWWMAPYLVGPFAASAVVDGAPTRSVVVLLLGSLASVTLGVWGLVEIGFRRGVRGANRYGEEPQPTN
jgi:uncharacterized membrane protein YhaH (DUF805 family)